MPPNNVYLSDTTTVLSNLSLSGNLAANSFVQFSTASLSQATIRALSVGTAGSPIPAISSTSSLVAPFVVQGSASSFTIIVWSVAQPGDHIIVTPAPTLTVSSLSSGLVAHSHCTQAGQVEFRLSNASTLAQNQSTRTWYFTRISPF